jgi:hypothetical protein
MGGYGVKEVLRASLIGLWKVADNHGSGTCRYPAREHAWVAQGGTDKGKPLGSLLPPASCAPCHSRRPWRSR